MYYLLSSIIGIVCFVLLFWKFPKLEHGGQGDNNLSVSVVIPFRNESHNVEGILKSLQNQTYKPFEIICVDDMSDDNTKQLIKQFDFVTLIEIRQKMQGVQGKAFACQQGANVATGDLILFLDADVRLSPSAIFELLETYKSEHCTVSVQPFHEVEKLYENGSLFFNLVQLAANGTCCGFHTKPAGLFGPVILIDSILYRKIGGHSCVGNSIVDDLEVAKALKKAGERFVIKTGGKSISFRMYPDGLQKLSQGWIKNIAVGATYTSPVIFALTFLWINGCCSSLILFYELLDTNLFFMAFISYFLWVTMIFVKSKKIGKFGFVKALFYPVWFVFFLFIFFVSMIKKIFHIPVTWKGRKIKWNEEICR